MDLAHYSALNQLAEVALASDDAATVLEAMASVVGPVLGVDRSLVYDVRFDEGVTVCLAEWLNPSAPAITPTRGVYPLAIFGDASQLLARGRAIVTSDRSDPHPSIGPAGWHVLHEQLAIGSLLWRPFAFRDQGFHLLAFNQLEERRWSGLEVSFIDAVSRQVSLALAKLQLAEERRRAHEAMAASEARYRALYDLTPSMFVTLDANLRVRSINRFALERLGWPEEAVLGQPGLANLEGAENERVSAELRRCLAEPGRVFHWDAMTTLASGRVMHSRQSGRASVGAEGALELFIDAQDVTEQKEAEAALLQSQKLETLGVLVGGIAHDFNNLLGTIKGNADLALMRLGADSPARAPIDQASLASQRAAELVRQLLAYSANAPASREPVRLNDLIRELTSLLDVTVGKRARMELDLAPALGEVMADPTQLRQVVMNLVHNAADAVLPTEGRVMVRTRVLAGSASAPPSVALEVVDDGAGIEAQHRDRIFDAFYTTKVEGRGLGLAAVKAIVERHGGVIEVESEAGAGSTFRVRIPAHVGDSAEAAPPSRTVSEAAPPSRGSVILVVDDERPLLDVVGAFIEEFGDRPLTANSVVEARDAFASHPEIACVLVDLTMPSGGGASLARAFKEQRPSVPVVLMSGFAHADVTRSLGSLLDAVLAKPFSPADLQRTLDRALGR
jgi:PAS domain S-box-containing protein